MAPYRGEGSKGLPKARMIPLERYAATSKLWQSLGSTPSPDNPMYMSSSSLNSTTHVNRSGTVGTKKMGEVDLHLLSSTCFGLTVKVCVDTMPNRPSLFDTRSTLVPFCVTLHGILLGVKAIL